MYDTQASSIPSVELEGLRFEAAGEQLIDIPSARFETAGITVLMGPNGAGKSLLLRLMHGLLQPDAGRIRCFGEDLSPAISRWQALVFQTPVLLRRSAEANVRFVLKTRGGSASRIGALFDMVGLTGKQETPARRLSGGERQRLAIAMALATDPKLLFLDEPTASLDPASVLAIEKIVTEAAARGVRIVFVTHDVGQARRLADDVVFMSNGRIAEHAPASRFFESADSPAAQAYLAGRLTSEV